MNSPVAKYLDPASHMAEVLFGLIMTLTFTLGASMVIQEEGREGAREMLIGILGCNVAWGIIDGMLYVLGRVFERGRLRRVGLKVRRAQSEPRALQLIAEELDDMLVPVTSEAQRESLYRNVYTQLRASPIPPNGVTRQDLLGGLVSGWLVFACSFPAVLPFVLLGNMQVALRVSNALLIGLLFVVGHRHAKNTLAKPWLTGLVFMLAGLVLVVITILLGG